MNPTVLKNLKQLREAANWTQDEVSKILNITGSEYSDYESGGREIPLNILERLSDLYGCEMAVFYEDDINAESLIITSVFCSEDLTQTDIEEIIRFNRIMKAYRKMERLENSSHSQKTSGPPPLKLEKYLYRSGNEGLVIENYVEQARKLFEAGKISEGHYYELLNIIGNDNAEN